MKPFLLSLLLLFPLSPWAQDLPDPTPTEEAVAPPDTETPTLRESDPDLETRLTLVATLQDSLRLARQRKSRILSDIEAAVDPAQREILLPRLNQVNQEIDALERDFLTTALQTDISLFEGDGPKKKFDLQSEAEQLLKPILAELKEATRESRELEALNQRLESGQERLAVAEEALANLEPLIEAASAPDLREKLEEVRTVWTQRKSAAENEIRFATQSLEKRREEQQTLLEKTGGMASGFVRTRGLNLFLGALAFAAVFLLMRAVQNGVTSIRPQKKKGRSFSSRLTSLVWTLLTVVAAIGAMLATFNMTGDWFLLSLTLVFLLGVGWAGIKTLPTFLEQFRMMLNLGAVREDERLVYEGIPWKVNAISFRTELVNPLLDGGRFQIPTNMLVGMLSRPPGEDEEWFPSRKDDWVLLSDGLFGRVAYQSPSFVQIVEPGGSQKMIPATDYLALAPKVLSTGFRHEVTFGIDYAHQPEATSAIPERMTAAVEEALRARVGDELTHVETLFGEAADSSLNLCVVIDCKGGAARDWPFIPRWTQSALVDLCTRENWGIPFPQLRVHTDA